MAYLKPQTPITLEDNYIYPLTTADQVITSTGERLNSLFKKTIRESVTLRATNWSETLPYTQTIILSESTDDYNVDVNIAYGNGDNAALNKAAGCLSYIKKNHKDITFYCLKNKPEVDIPIEITGTCRNTIATVEEGVKLNFGIKRYDTEEELLADTPKENTIGIISDVEINGYRFSATEPKSVNEGEVWIDIGTDSDISFDIIDGATVHLISANQYVNSKWVNVDGKAYIDSEWIQFSPTWDGTLFYKGNQYTDITGGWRGSVSIATNSVVTLSGTTAVGDDFYTAQKIEKGSATKLYVNVPSLTRANGVLNIVVTRTNDGTAADDGKMYAYAEITGKGKHYVSLSGVTAPFYVYFYTYNNITATIDKVWME